VFHFDAVRFTINFERNRRSIAIEAARPSMVVIT
jgi:hypothetical protein